MQDIVYILINEAMPNYVKVGITSDLEQRIRSLDTTGIPLPFECFYATKVKDARFVEKQLHDAFDDVRIRSSREFFEIAPERIASALRIAELEDVTPNQDYVESAEDQVALNQAKERSSAFNFKMVEIPVGSEIYFTRNPEIKAIVVDNKNIKFQEEVMSATKAAQIALETERAVQGPLYWEYEGETLVERRKRLESE
jgi:hypothetical protein